MLFRRHVQELPEEGMDATDKAVERLQPVFHFFAGPSRNLPGSRFLRCGLPLTGTIAVLAVAFSILPMVAAHAADSPFLPWDHDGRQIEAAAGAAESSAGSAFLLGALYIYRNYVSPVNGDRCPMIPTCSSYAVQAVRKHGFFLGIMMTADRLMHEPDEIRHAHPVVGGGRVGFEDPVSNNDFWWYRKEANKEGL